jgi:hypothetical protein
LQNFLYWAEFSYRYLLSAFQHFKERTVVEVVFSKDEVVIDIFSDAEIILGDIEVDKDSDLEDTWDEVVVVDVVVEVRAVVVVDSDLICVVSETGATFVVDVVDNFVVDVDVVVTRDGTEMDADESNASSIITLLLELTLLLME